MTLARSMGFPFKAETTCTVSFVGSAAVSRAATKVRTTRTARIVFIKLLCDIGNQKMAGTAGGSRHGFGGNVSAAHRAFHSGRPSGAGPVTGHEEIGELRSGLRSFQ